MADNRFSRELPRDCVCGILTGHGGTEDAAVAMIVAEMRRVGLIRFYTSPVDGVVMATIDLVLPPHAVAVIGPLEQKPGPPALSSEDGFDWDALARARKKYGSY